MFMNVLSHRRKNWITENNRHTKLYFGICISIHASTLQEYLRTLAISNTVATRSFLWKEKTIFLHPKRSRKIDALRSTSTKLNKTSQTSKLSVHCYENRKQHPKVTGTVIFTSLCQSEKFLSWMNLRNQIWFTDTWEQLWLGSSPTHMLNAHK